MDLQERAHLGSTNLRELIEDFRRSRTRNEERMTIQKHRGYLRENMKTLNHEQRSNGILKLMWMNMLGYDTEFALVECMNSLFLDNFKLKTIGYLGLTMFLSRKSEVLLMVTNRLRLDLENISNDFVVSAALKTFSEIGDDNMSQELFPILKTLLGHESKYIRKKVCLALKRVLMQKPDLTLELKPSFLSLLRENNSGLLLCTLHLARKILKEKPKEFHPIFCDAHAHLLGKLRQTSAKSSGNYLINGVNDPFLQAELVGFLLEFLSLPQTRALDHFEDMVSEFGSCLLSVYREIQDFGGSTARAMFYQIARAIMQIPYSAIALKKVGIAILGGFLGLKNRNYLFVSLKMLCLISQKYSSEVSRHNSLIMKCVNDKDFSIKRLALQILLQTTDADNLREVCQLFFKEIRKESNPRRAREMAGQSLQLIQRAGSTRLEIIDLIFELLQNLHRDVKLSTESLLPFFHLVANGEQSQLYSCLRALHILGNPESREKKSLLFAGCWVLGEFGETLILGKDLKSNQRFTKLSWSTIIGVLLKISPPCGQQDMEVGMFILTALLKVFHKASNLENKQKIVDWFIHNARHRKSMIAEKSRQYLRLMKLSPEDLEEILESLGFNNEKVEERLKSIQEGVVEVETLDGIACQINEGRFAQGDSKSRLTRVVPSGEEHVLGESKTMVMEDMDLMKMEENNGLQNEGDEMEVIDLLQMDIDVGPQSEKQETQEASPELDLLGNNQNDINLLGDDFGVAMVPQSGDNVQNQPGFDDNDFLGMMGSTQKKNIDKLSHNIDQMMDLEMTDKKEENLEKEQITKKKGLGKPRSGLRKLKSKETQPEQQVDDLDFLGGQQTDPVPQPTNNFDLLDNIDLMGETKPVLEIPKTGEYSALDDLDNVLIRGNEAPTKPLDDPLNLMNLQAPPANIPSKTQTQNGTDYDCLDLGINSDSILTGKPGINVGATDDFGDDDFVECEVVAESEIKTYKTFFENQEILLEHSTKTSGLNKYHIENVFTSRSDFPMTGLRLNIQLQKHVKTKLNRLSSSNLGSKNVRTVSQLLELEDQSGFSKPLKIKMTLKYTIMGTERVHQFIVNNFV